MGCVSSLAHSRCSTNACFSQERAGDQEEVQVRVEDRQAKGVHGNCLASTRGFTDTHVFRGGDQKGRRKWQRSQERAREAGGGGVSGAHSRRSIDARRLSPSTPQSRKVGNQRRGAGPPGGPPTPSPHIPAHGRGARSGAWGRVWGWGPAWPWLRGT